MIPFLMLVVGCSLIVWLKVRKPSTRNNRNYLKGE